MNIAEMQQGSVQFRAAAVAECDTTSRELLVVAAPYERQVDIGGGILESFAAGAFASAAAEPHRIGVWHRHGGPLVGRGISVEDRPDGVHLRARLASTPAAVEMLTLIEEKVLTDISVEFRALRGSMIVRDLGGGRFDVRHKKALLRGVAVVDEGAYGELAYIESLRDAQLGREAEAARAWLAVYAKGNPFAL